jgi:hypothetical protein
MANRAPGAHPIASVLGAAASASVAAASGCVGLLSAYLGVVTASALRGGSRLPGPSSHGDPTRRFVIAVPAHNEETVIADALRSFRALDYPRELFAVHVVADNCTDATARVVREHGYVAHERIDVAEPGKGPALNWLHDRLVVDGVDFDTLVVVDADTTVQRSFLHEMARALDHGAVAAQGYYGVRDPGESPATSLRYAALACRHHLRPLGRQRLGGSSGLYGNGMAFDRDVVATYRWSGHLTEDVEFQMELLLRGRRIAYVPGAQLEAEMPVTLDAATPQNERWELGRIQMVRRYLPELARRARTAGPSRTVCADAAIDQLVPPISVLTAASGLTAAAGLVLTVLHRSRLDRFGLAVSAGSALIIVVHVATGLRSVRAPRAVYRAMFQAPRVIAWKTLLWLRVLVRPEHVRWTRTARNSDATDERSSS